MNHEANSKSSPLRDWLLSRLSELVLLGILGGAIWAAMAGYSYFFGDAEPVRRSTWEVAQCDEPVRIMSCIGKDTGPSCVFENTSPQTLASNPRAWGYNAQGVQVSQYPILLAGIMPGQKRQADLVLGDFHDVTRVVACSMDPEHPLIRGHVSKVATVNSK